MPSVIKGYEYDIFISYRQKDNKADKWVTHFVEALQDEIEATFKEDISIYFDENPHDGLLETHDVDQSLSEKIKVLVFIPIISQTYCDPNCFAWQKEFIAFRDFATNDELGLNIRLSNGNVCKRILPVRIHEIDNSDQELYEIETGGVMRPVDFIFKSSGVNRALRHDEDNPHDNLNKTFYRDQINKVANGIKEIIVTLRQEESNPIVEKNGESITSTLSSKIRNKSFFIASFFALILAMTAIWYFNFYNQPQVLSEASRNARVAIIPFTNNTNEHELDILGDMAAEYITRGLMNFDHIKVVSPETMRDNKEFTDLENSNMRAEFTERTDADNVIKGSFYLDGENIVFQIQVINLATNEVEKALPPIIGQQSNLEGLVIKLNQKVMTIFGLHDFTSQVLIEDPPKYDSYKMYSKAFDNWFIDYPKCRYYFSEAIRLDSSFLHAYMGLLYSYKNTGETTKVDSLLGFINNKFTNVTPMEQVMLDYMNSETNWDRYTLMKIWFKKDPKNLMVNYQMGLDASKINKPNEVVNICESLGTKDISLINPVFAMAWYCRFAYNLIRRNELDEAYEILGMVPIEQRYIYFYSLKTLILVLKDEPVSIHKMIKKMEENGVDQNLIIRACLETSDWYALQGDSESQKEWAKLSIEKIKLISKSEAIDQYHLSWAYFSSQDYENALSLYEDLVKSNNANSLALALTGVCYAKTGLIEMAQDIINELDSINTSESKYRIALIYTALNEKGLAVEYLQKAFEEDYSFYFGLYDTDCKLLPLHGHPGYEELVRPKG